MIKNIMTLGVILGITFVFLWLYQNSGSMVFDALGYHIETSFTLFTLLLIISLVIFCYLVRIVLLIINLPTTFMGYWKIDIPMALDNLLVEIYQHNHKKSQKLLRKISSYLPTNLLNILNLEVVTLKEDVGEIKLAFMKLAQSEATMISGMEGLITLARQEGEWEDVINYCEQLLKNHQSEWLISHFIYALMMLEKWERCSQFLEGACNTKFLSKLVKRKLLAISYYKLAHRAFVNRDYAVASQCSNLSYRNFSNFVPNLILLAQIHSIDAKYDESMKWIRLVWKLKPHSSVSEFLLSLQDQYTKEKFFKIIKGIVSCNSQHYESYLLLAQAAMKVGEDQKAFDAISHAQEYGPQFRVCIAMAEYCQKTQGSVHEVMKWLQQAMHAKIDILHICYFWDFNSMDIVESPTNQCVPVAKL